MKTKYWWEAADSDLHLQVTNTVKKIDEQQAYRRAANQKFMGVYENRKVKSLDGRGHMNRERSERLKVNISASCVDALSSMITSQQTRPVFDTVGGDYNVRRKGKKLTRFSDGQFLQLKLPRRNQAVGDDGLIYGTGFIKFYNDLWSNPTNPRMLAERVFPDEVLVDDQDGRYIDDPPPWSMFQVKEISKSVLMRRFPRFKEDIKQASLIRTDSSGMTNIDDPCSVMMCWHRPSIPEGLDGRYAMCLTTCPLVDDKKWTSSEEAPFPIIPWRWKRRSLGYYGIGVIEELETIQEDITYCAEEIQNYVNLGALALWVQKDANISVEKLADNLAMRIIKGDVKPEVLQLLQIPQQLIDHFLWLIQEAYQIIGITQMSATGMKPAGLDSGSAQREFKDTQSQRFIKASKSWDQFHVDETELMLDLAKEMDKKAKGGYKVLVRGPYGAEEIKWKDVNLPREKWILECRASSALPLTPAARKQEVIEALEAGLVQPARALKLLNWPDLEAESKRLNAPMDTVEMLVERCLYEESQEGDLKDVRARAEPFMLPFAQQALELANGEYFLAKNSDIPDERLQLCRDFMKDLERLIEEQRQAMMAQAAEMAQAQQGMMPGAPPPGPEMGGEPPPPMPEIVPPVRV